MESQIRVLEYESLLEKERLKLAALRKQHYQLASETNWHQPTDISLLTKAKTIITIYCLLNFHCSSLFKLKLQYLYSITLQFPSIIYLKETIDLFFLMLSAKNVNY